MKQKFLIYGIFVLIIIMNGCGQQIAKVEESAVEFQLLRKIEVAEAGYPTVIFTNSHFYVSYELGGIISLEVYDENFTVTAEVTQLTTPEGGDHQMVYGDGYFYLVSSFNLRKFDSSFKEIKSVSIFANLPTEVAEKWSGEGGLDDMLLCYADGCIYLGIAVGESKMENGKKLDTPDDLYLQIYNQNLEVTKGVTLENLGNTPASSMLFQNGIYTVVCGNRHWDDSSLIAAHYDSNWNLTGRTTLSAVANANEEFPMGFLYENGYYYVSYNYITGELSQPTEGEPIRRQDIMLKAFDSSWNLAGETIVTSDIPSSNTTLWANAAHLAIAGNKIYVAYDSTEENSFKIFVKEYEIVKN